MVEQIARVFIGEGSESVEVAVVTIRYSEIGLTEKDVDGVIAKAVLKLSEKISKNLNKDSVEYT